MYFPKCECTSENGGAHYGLEVALNLVNKVRESKTRALLILASPVLDNSNYFENQLKKIKYKKVFLEIQDLVYEVRDDTPYVDSGISKVELAIFDIDAS